MENVVFRVPYNSNERGVYQHWALKKNFKIISDEVFRREDTLEIIKVEGSNIYVEKIDCDTENMGCFVTLLPVDPKIDLEIENALIESKNSQILMRKFVSDGKNLIGVLFVVFEGSKSVIKFNINEKENMVVEYECTGESI
jgi:hypothetical protein